MTPIYVLALEGIQISDEVFHLVFREIGKGRHAPHRLAELKSDALGSGRIIALRKCAPSQDAFQTRSHDRSGTQGIVAGRAPGSEECPAQLDAHAVGPDRGPARTSSARDRKERTAQLKIEALVH